MKKTSATNRLQTYQNPEPFEISTHVKTRKYCDAMSNIKLARLPTAHMLSQTGRHNKVLFCHLS